MDPTSASNVFQNGTRSVSDEIITYVNRNEGDKLYISEDYYFSEI